MSGDRTSPRYAGGDRRGDRRRRRHAVGGGSAARHPFEPVVPLAQDARLGDGRSADRRRSGNERDGWHSASCRSSCRRRWQRRRRRASRRASQSIRAPSRSCSMAGARYVSARMSIRWRSCASSRRWRVMPKACGRKPDEPGAYTDHGKRYSARMAGDRPYRPAQGVHVVRRAGAGDVRPRPARRALVRVPGQAR